MSLARPPNSKTGYVLPWTVSPHADESLPGLALRHAAEYRFHDPMRLFKRISPPKLVLWTFCQLPPASAVGTRSKDLLGLDEATFRRMSLWSATEFHHSIQGHDVWSDLVRNDARAFCPLCLQDSLHHRSSWLVSPFTLCAKHATPIRNRCHVCKGLLTWTGMGVHRCGKRGCRADLRECPPGPAEPENVGAVIALERLLRVGDAATPFGMPPGEAIRLSFLFGQLGLGFEKGRRYSRAPSFIKREQAQVAALMNVGWNTLSDWPRNFHALLEKLRERAGERAGKHGLVKAFGKMSLLVYELARQPWGEPFGAAFTEYAASLPELRTSTRRLERYAPGTVVQDEHVSLSEARRQLGMSPSPMMALAERRGLYVVRPVGGGAPSKVRAADVAKLKAELVDWLLPSEARAILGVGNKVMDQLENAGLIRRVPPTERVMIVRPFRRSEIEAFVAACVGKAEFMTLTQAAQAHLTPITRASVRRPVTDICKALVEGQLRPVGCVKEAKGLMQVRLRMRDVEAAVLSRNTTLPLKEVTKSLGCQSDAVVTWVRRGFLQTVTTYKRGENGTRIEEEALQRFRREYIFGRELGVLFDQEKNSNLSRHLRHLGVEPVSAKDLDGSVTALFRRSDCTPEVIAAVLRLQQGSSESPQERHRASFARAGHAARVVQKMWNADFKRMHNTYSDRVSSRTLQAVSGRRPDMKGLFRFILKGRSLEDIETDPGAWVALVPNEGKTFLLVPSEKVAWTRDKVGDGYLTLHLDRSGRARELEDALVVPLEALPETDPGR